MKLNIESSPQKHVILVIENERQKGRVGEREGDRQTVRQTDRQTERQTSEV